MRWGFRMLKRPTSPLHRSADGKEHGQSTLLVFNTRSEQADTKPLFADSLRERRCLIPCQAYYEWDHREKPAPKYLFRPAEAGPVLLCGIYRHMGDRLEFSVLTREAAPDIFRFHDRMPVMLPPALARSWLDRDVPASSLFPRALTDIAYTRCDGSA